MENNDIKSGKTSAVISYFYLLGVLIAYLTNAEKKSQFAYFHIRQSLGLWLTFLALGYPVGYFDNWQITFSFWIAFAIIVMNCIRSYQYYKKISKKVSAYV